MADGRSLTSGLPVLVVLGPTATGKTELAIRCARAFGGEVVSADSRYFYREMNIGTAKPTLAEQAGIPHHLIDILDPDQPYSLGQFLDDVYRVIEDIGNRGGLPVVAGGTPQYLRATLEGWTVPEVAPDDELRARLETEPTETLFARLVTVDLESALRIGTTNKRRIIRALEIHEKTGRTVSEQSGKQPPPYRFHVIGLTQPRDLLYARIDERVRRMYAEGWLNEARELYERGITATHPSMSAHGYREALEVVTGQTDVEDAIARTCFIIHRYVRHQQTWFRRFDGVEWFDSSVAGWQEEALDSVRTFL
ncbi:MAG: tRNA (adenosine(37)-N6)-dimethylallyltransferase MiaA, partial [Thermomicrobiales bacterium]